MREPSADRPSTLPEAPSLREGAHTLPARLANTAAEMLGPQGAAWLARLPETVSSCARRWALTLEPPFAQLSINYAAPGVRADGAAVVLKVCIPGPEFATEAEALRLYDGRGALQLLAADPDQGALLLERLLPGTPLSAVADDEQATHIAAGVMGRLWRPAPAGHAFPSFTDWVRHMAECAPCVLGPDTPFPNPSWIGRALALFEELIASAAEPVLLHGDLHQGNILAAEREPWLCIDPKGVVGEPVCETGPLLLNELPSPADAPAVRRVLHQRVDQLAEELGFDRARLRAWGVVRAVLAGFWTLEDHGGVWEGARACAEALS